MAMGPISSRSGNGRRAPMAEINVTPLVDVMLVLLIIFMVTAPLLTAGVPVDLPKTRAGQVEQQKKPTTISIDAAGKVYIDDAEIGLDALPDRLAALASGRTGEDAPQIFVRADKAIDWGRVAVVMGELNRAGLNKVALITVGGDEGR